MTDSKKDNKTTTTKKGGERETERQRPVNESHSNYWLEDLIQH